jgi:hypothetical protein
MTMHASSGTSRRPGFREVVTACVVAGTVASLVLAVPHSALANPPLDFSVGKTVMTVTPSENLAATQSVTVEGSGWPASHVVTALQCSNLFSPASEGTVCSSALGTTTTDGDGDFSMTITVTKTFSGFVFPQFEAGTHTCQPTDDCVVQVTNIVSNLDPPRRQLQTPQRFAWHHIDFAS